MQSGSFFGRIAQYLLHTCNTCGHIVHSFIHATVFAALPRSIADHLSVKIIFLIES